MAVWLTTKRSRSEARWGRLRSFFLEREEASGATADDEEGVPSSFWIDDSRVLIRSSSAWMNLCLVGILHQPLMGRASGRAYPLLGPRLSGTREKVHSERLRTQLPHGWALDGVESGVSDSPPTGRHLCRRPTVSLALQLRAGRRCAQFSLIDRRRCRVG